MQIVVLESADILVCMIPITSNERGGPTKNQGLPGTLCLPHARAGMMYPKLEYLRDIHASSSLIVIIGFLAVFPVSSKVPIITCLAFTTLLIPWRKLGLE